MTHKFMEYTEEEAEKNGWSCWMCVNSNERPFKINKECLDCKVKKAGDRPSQFSLRKN